MVIEVERRLVTAIVSVKANVLSISMRDVSRERRRSTVLRIVADMSNDPQFPTSWEAAVLGERADCESVMSLSFAGREDVMRAKRVAEDYVARWLP